MSDAERPAFSFLVCPDSRLLRAHLDAQAAAFPPPRGQWERHVYWGDEEPPQSFWERLSLPGLFGGFRLLLVRQAQLWPVAIWKKVSRALARPADSSWPVFCLEMGWERGKPKLPAHLLKLGCWQFAEKRGLVWQRDGLGERGIRRHVQERAKALGLRFAPDALEQFCAAVPPDARAIENELDKLRLVCGAEVIRPAMTASAAWSPECDIFACIRCLEAGNAAGAWRELSRGKDAETTLFPLLGLLAREFRTLWQLAHGEVVRIPPQALSAKSQLASRLGAERLAEGLALICHAEWRIKSGRWSVDQALDMLAARICALFGARGASC